MSKPRSKRRARPCGLGVVDGAVILARTENDITDAGAGPIRSSSVMVCPPAEAHRASSPISAHHYPILGLSALVTDVDSVSRSIAGRPCVGYRGALK